MHAFHDQHGVQVIQAWGMTETSPLASVARAPATAAVDDAWRYRYTQGRLVASVRGRLVSDAGEVLPWDGSSVGELEVAGPWVTGCYNGGADPDKFHDGWLRTGDVGHLTPDGFLTLTDRAKDVIKSGGEWISSVELENAVMAHPAVAEAAVIGVPDEKWDERPLVAVVPAQGEQISAAELRDFLIDKVAKWQLPDYWAFVDEIPKTSVGKFDKKQLRTDHSQGRLNLSRAT
jgi:fatty-acyl-CoA synthase